MASRRYFGEWSRLGDVAAAFEGCCDAADEEVLFASYDWSSGVGVGFVLLRRNGLMLQVNGLHASRGQMGGQWEPEPAIIEALRMRSFGGMADDSRAALMALLDEIERGSVA